MRMNNNSDDIDKIFEMMLKKSLEDFAEESGQKIIELSKSIDDLKNPIYTQEFKENMDKIINKAGYFSKIKKINNGRYFHRFKSRYKLSFTIICLAAIFMITVCTNANKIKFINILFHTETDHIDIINNVSSVKYPDIELPGNWDYLYLPEKIPVGYIFDKINFSESFITARYSSSDKINLIFTQYRDLHNMFSLDTENSNIKQIMINSENGFIIKNESNSILIWNNDICSFTLSGNCSKEELIESAESLKIFSK